MFAGRQHSSLRRRGVVLVVILGMLGLLALIGVTFATFSGQAKVNARNFSQAQNFPDSSEVMDFALSQLIDDTANPQSAIRGHSLKRDMYGNDAWYNGYLASRPDHGLMGPNNDSLFYMTGPVDDPNGSGLWVIQTNIPANDPAFYGYNFTRWSMRVTRNNVPAVTQTFEILKDDPSGNLSAYRIFYVAPPPPSPPTSSPYTDTTTVLERPDNGNKTGPAFPSTAGTYDTNVTFTLDGRYLYAFNGPGMESWGVAAGLGQGVSRYANFRVNGGLLGKQTNTDAPVYGTPDPIPGAPTPPYQMGISMDEDYDACDLENWFLALQSADGQVIIPSFHRPGILTATDWTNTGAAGTVSMSKILRPRAVDHNHNITSFRDLTPNADGTIDYDVDNDGDGKTDSVWLDLGYPAKRDPEGHLFKPLFAFLIIGLNGRLPLNTAGNLALRNLVGVNLWDHAAHLGNSPSEIDLRYALQNANLPRYAQYDNAGINAPGDSPIPVCLTQLRNILTGTRLVDQARAPNYIGDINKVQMGVDSTGNPISTFLPNNVADAADNPSSTLTAGKQVFQNTPAVWGRWGEGDSVPGISYPLLPPSTIPGGIDTKTNPAGTIPTNRYTFSNFIRAGRSSPKPDTNGLPYDTNGNIYYADSADDDLDSFDAWPPYPPPNRLGETNDSDLYDNVGTLVLPVERMRRFVTPIDIAGDGQLVAWGTWNTTTNSPNNTGADGWGRVSFFHYFRPAGLPGQYNSAGVIASLPAGTPNEDRNNNPTHGYDSFRNPDYTQVSPPLDARIYGGALWDQDFNTQTPTYDPYVNANILPGQLNSAQVMFISPALNHANEMNLYQTNWNDSPFGPGDLEWLYRQQDSDSASLQSRLASLAPISFVQAPDAQRRRRLFALESWELNRYVWASDNPGNSFGTTAATANARFLAPVPASFANFTTATTFPPFQTDPTGITYTGTPTPQLAQLGRKINLNYPLPVSNDPSEPVRQKWITNTYYTLKAILPPKSIDTVYELAQLSQFVINIVDFRDPDGAITQWINPDVKVVPVTMNSSANPPTYAPPSLVPAVDAPANAVPLVQYGMEYNPLAINEAVAFAYTWRDDVSNPGSVKQSEAYRFYAELINTLTDPVQVLGTPNPPTSSAFDLTGNFKAKGQTNPTGFDISGWQMLILPDDPTGRPDPISGQMPTLDQSVITYLQTQPQFKKFYPWDPAHPPAGGGGTPITPSIMGADSTKAPTVDITAGNFFPIIPPLLSQNSNNVDGPDNLTPPTHDYYLDNSYAQSHYFVIGNKAPQSKDATKPTEQVAGPNSSTSIPVSVTLRDTHPLMAALNQSLTFAPNSKPDRTATPTPNPTYLWLYLLRPANPLAQPNPATNPLVVVDSFRFPYIEAGAHATSSSLSQDNVDTQGTQPMYSAQRLQPFRGGHAMTQAPGSTAFLPGDAYGYSEQTSPPPITNFGSPSTRVVQIQPLYGNTGSQVKGSNGPRLTSQPICTTLGFPNNPKDNDWEYIPFHDRDFTSVAELLLVPGCPPGLFTKKFAEFAPNNSWSFNPTQNPPIGSSPPQVTPFAGAPGAPNTFPYLVDNFFYTGAPEFTLPGTTPLSPPFIGGPSGAGWFKMLDIFEVPSPVVGAIGPVSEGENFDWMRQDLRPGLLNLNLIIDEEVFYGLLADSRLNNNQIAIPPGGPGPIVGTVSSTGIMPPTGTQTPAIVTQILPNGTPSAAFFMPNVGWSFDPTQPINPAGTPPNPASVAKMKAAFSDFLKLRHGGSGFLFGFGTGFLGDPNSTIPSTALASERPFHSLSYPDINYTVMRPATLPPSGASSPTATTSPISLDPRVIGPLPTAQPTTPPFAWDPGIKNPYLFLPAASGTQPGYPPPIPTRRLFEIPDANAASNAGENTSDPFVNSQTQDPSLMNPNADLVLPPTAGQNYYLGGNSGTDRRQHPYWRTEWLQKVMNLTTVRTHQFAVWITVGFFEVTKQGDPLLANTNPSLAYDQLGLELGVLSGRNVRYRSFFLLDRTKAVGFNPSLPGGFRGVVVYRQKIE